MIVVAHDQTTETRTIALLNLERHRAGLCAANHDIEYSNGWLRVDGGSQFRRPDLVAQAQKDRFLVGYWQEGNCYVVLQD